MKTLALFVLLLISFTSFAQEYEIQDFSSKYYGKIYITDIEKYSKKGWIAVYEKGMNKQLIKLACDDIFFWQTEDGKATANVLEVPYGEQSVLIYNDFNFDGEKDFAISTGHHSQYAGPSFDIYLYHNGSFTYSESFSSLSNDYSGMFDFNAEKKRLYTSSKSGCCWHEYSEFIVENNEPKVVRIEEYDQYSPPWPYTMIVTETVWDGEQMVTRISRKELGIDQRSIDDFLFYVELENGKKLFLAQCVEAVEGEEKVLIRYIFTDEEGTIELEYPKAGKQGKFTYAEDDDDNKTCSFSNGNAKYVIYDYTTPKRKVGIKVTVQGKTYDLKGKPETAAHLLNKITAGYSNVVGYSNVNEYL